MEKHHIGLEDNTVKLNAQFDTQVNAITIKNPIKTLHYTYIYTCTCRHIQDFVYIHMYTIPKFILKYKGIITKNIFVKKTKVGWIRVPNFKTYYIVTVINTVENWQRGRQNRSNTRTKNPKRDPHKYAQLIFDKVQNQFNGNIIFNKLFWSNWASIGKREILA